MANDQKLISCCELLELFNRYYSKKFGVDGIILFEEDIRDENFPPIWEITASIFKYFEKKEKLCEKCKKNWKKMRGD
ncbi:MAG: hypothetical protein MRERC_7c087 [Mycoplasmataceae bacterium RC_NB112A]|nr:MAG: hypothetical protein MRERC_9c007 [Mycoplasmataceae bacterium RC_NB112A]KLL01918.1 MAG: hypothetical protein MRERC_7c087 [Mycoplasmataceae bacterium RC_NB112A]